MYLDNVRLLVSDFDGCFRFYRDVMGFPVTWGEEGSGYASFKTGEGSGLALFNRASMAQAVGTADRPADATSQDRVALIFGVDDLDAAIARLRQRGARLVTEPAERPDWGIRTAHVRDPDGNLLEIMSSLPTTEWSEDLRDEAAREQARPAGEA
jgi:lactoylglutathione lyase